jgi:predicted transcriptional regulator of viral defense system
LEHFVRLPEAIDILSKQDLQQQRFVFLHKDLELLFAETGIKLTKTLERLVQNGILIRAARGVYVYAQSRHKGAYVIEDVACALRRYDYNFISYESALSEYGVISQVPIGWLTVATTGREGRYETPFGIIDFTHTEQNPQAIIANTLEYPPHPLRIANAAFAVKNLKRTGRNTDLIDETWREGFV